MSRNYKRNRSSEEYKRLSLYLPADLADRIRAESEARLESQNMVVGKILAGFFSSDDRMVEAAMDRIGGKGSDNLRRLRDDVLAKSFTRED